MTRRKKFKIGGRGALSVSFMRAWFVLVLVLVFYFPVVLILFGSDLIPFLSVWLIFYVILLFGTVVFILFKRSRFPNERVYDFKYRVELIYIVVTFFVLAIAMLAFLYSVNMNKTARQEMENNVIGYLCAEYMINIDTVRSSIDIDNVSLDEIDEIEMGDQDFRNFFEEKGLDRMPLLDLKTDAMIHAFKNGLFVDKEMMDDFQKISIANTRLYSGGGFPFTVSIINVAPSLFDGFSNKLSCIDLEENFDSIIFEERKLKFQKLKDKKKIIDQYINDEKS